jgi:hypothetical protein
MNSTSYLPLHFSSVGTSEAMEDDLIGKSCLKQGLQTRKGWSKACELTRGSGNQAGPGFHLKANLMAYIPKSWCLPN